jgi:hypothetical protein
VLTAFAPERDDGQPAGDQQARVTLLPLAGPQLTGAAVAWRF